MSARTRFLTAALVTVGLAACAPQAADDGGEMTQAVDVAAEAQAIRDLSAEWLEAYRSRDAAAIANNFAPDGETIFDGEYVMGRDAIQASSEAEFAEMGDFSMSWSTTSVEMAASGDLAVERGEWTFDPDGAGEAPAVQGQYVTTWKKMDGRWQVLVDAGTTIEEGDGGEMGEM